MDRQKRNKSKNQHLGLLGVSIKHKNIPKTWESVLRIA